MVQFFSTAFGLLVVGWLVWVAVANVLYRFRGDKGEQSAPAAVAPRGYGLADSRVRGGNRAGMTGPILADGSAARGVRHRRGGLPSRGLRRSDRFDLN